MVPKQTHTQPADLLIDRDGDPSRYGGRAFIDALRASLLHDTVDPRAENHDDMVNSLVILLFIFRVWFQTTD